jgi:hypothetical protein
VADYAVTDHAEAAAALLEALTKQLRSGVSPEEIGPQLVLIGRIMARKT